MASTSTGANDDDFLCHVCGACLDSKDDLERHIKNDHRKRKKISCKIEDCNYKASGEVDLYDHHEAMHLHNKKFKYDCMICGKVVHSRHENLQHKETHRSSKSQKFICACEQEFSQFSKLEFHYKTQHLVGELSSRDYSVVSTDGTTSYKCKYCESKTSTKWNMKEHKLRFHFSESLTCVICDIDWNSPHKYHEHLQLEHKDSSKFVCLVKACKSQFDDSVSLIIHYKKTHLPFITKDVKVLQCNICHEIYGRVTDLRYHHMEDHHLFLSSCQDCDRRYRNWSTLTAHRQQNHPEAVEESLEETKNA